MTDIFGNEVYYGDLVVTSTSKSGRELTLANIGVVVGANSCFTLLDGKPYIHSFKHCYHLSNKEAVVDSYCKKLCDSCRDYIEESASKKETRNKSKWVQSVGDIYTWKDSYYLYLGVCDLTHLYAHYKLNETRYKGEHIYTKLPYNHRKDIDEGNLSINLERLLCGGLTCAYILDNIIHTKKPSSKFLGTELVSKCNLTELLSKDIIACFSYNNMDKTRLNWDEELFIKSLTVPQYRESQYIYFKLRGNGNV